MTINETETPRTFSISPICHVDFHDACSAHKCDCSCHAVYICSLSEENFRWAMLRTLYDIKFSNRKNHREDNGKRLLDSEDVELIVRRAADECTDEDAPESLIQGILTAYPEEYARPGWSWGDFCDDLKRVLDIDYDPFDWKKDDDNE